MNYIPSPLFPFYYDRVTLSHTQNIFNISLKPTKALSLGASSLRLLDSCNTGLSHQIQIHDYVLEEQSFPPLELYSYLACYGSFPIASGSDYWRVNSKESLCKPQVSSVIPLLWPLKPHVLCAANRLLIVEIGIFTPTQGNSSTCNKEKKKNGLYLALIFSLAYDHKECPIV